MKKFLLVLLLPCFIALPGCGDARKQPERQSNQPAGSFPPQLLAFSEAKERQARALAASLNVPVPPEVTQFFQLAAHGDTVAVTNLLEGLIPEFAASMRDPVANPPPPWAPFFQPMNEVESAYEYFLVGGTKYSMAFGQGIIESIPPGSIYFGGTDSGRMLVTALCESHADGKPFYTVTQNALSDPRYMDYVRMMYGEKIYLPTTNDVQAATDDYKADALQRLKHDQDFPREPIQIKPGEDVRLVDGQVQVDGQVCVMAIHARLVKTVLEHNPDREFYLEESYPLELVNSYLSPHGLIFKLNHEPLAELSPEMLDADHAYWTKQCGPMLGDWLKPGTRLAEVCAFVQAVDGKKDFSHFTGDTAFVTNDFAKKAFSKLRVSIAGLYYWRLMNKPKAADRARLSAEADYAFRQAFAMCPTSPEVVFRYVNLLMLQNRFDDAILLTSTAHDLDPGNDQFDDLLSQLKSIRAQIKRSAK